MFPDHFSFCIDISMAAAQRAASAQRAALAVQGVAVAQGVAAARGWHCLHVERRNPTEHDETRTESQLQRFTARRGNKKTFFFLVSEAGWAGRRTV